jgi:hypothetical protein
VAQRDEIALGQLVPLEQPLNDLEVLSAGKIKRPGVPLAKARFELAKARVQSAFGQLQGLADRRFIKLSRLP